MTVAKNAACISKVNGAFSSTRPSRSNKNTQMLDASHSLGTSASASSTFVHSVDRTASATD